MVIRKCPPDRILGGILAAVLLLAVGLSNQARAEPEAFYADETLRIVVGFNPGGGYDGYARAIAPEIERRTGATVVVDNQPGGGGLLALNRLVQGSADGTTIMLVSAESAALALLTERPGTRFDFDGLTWLGRAAVDTRIALWSARHPERTFEEVLARMREDGATWGANGLTDAISDATSAMAHALDLTPEELGIVIGYSGSSEIAAAAVRGEVDGIMVSSTSAVNYVGEESLVPIVTLARERDQHFPEVPTLFEVADLDEESTWWADFRADITTLGRAFVAHQDVDPARVAYLREILGDILRDEDFLAAMEEKSRPIDYLPAAEQEQLARQLLDDLSDERREEVRHVLTEKYIR